MPDGKGFTALSALLIPAGCCLVDKNDGTEKTYALGSLLLAALGSTVVAAEMAASADWKVETRIGCYRDKAANQRRRIYTCPGCRHGDSSRSQGVLPERLIL